MGGERATVAARQVLGEGFHRTLVTSVLVETARESAAAETSRLAAECVVALVEHLPREVYVDFDEVADQRRLGVAGVPMLVGIGLEKGLDVEKPAEVSQAFSIATIASHVSLRVRDDIDAHIGDDDLVLRAEFRLPLHFRYQAPAHATFAQAHIQKPESVWVACPDQSSSSAGHNRQPPFAVEANGFVWRESTLLTDMALNSVTVDIPVGSLDDAFIVHTVTALVTMLGALFLVFAVHMRRERSTLKQE